MSGGSTPMRGISAGCSAARVQKLSVDAGFTCPNRDGTIGKGGCTFCDNGAFTPSYCTPAKSVRQQIDEGIEFHRNRYRTARRYLVYFQSFSNTYAPLERLKELYGEALAHPEVAGIVVGTRPDCVDEAKLDWFAELARDRYVALEYGIESTCDASLRAVNRGHDFAWRPPGCGDDRPSGDCPSGRTLSWGFRARRTRCCWPRRSGSTPCRSRP